jgi:hypothetical protein
MPDRIQSYKVVCAGGLNSNENHLELSDNQPGAATRLVNYEVSLYGGYRRIEGFTEYNSSYPEVGAGLAEGPVLCTAIFKSDTQGTIVIAARKDIGAATYSFYRHVPNAAWVKYDLSAAALGHNHTDIVRATTDGVGTVNKIRFTKFNFGASITGVAGAPTNLIVFVDGVNPAIITDGVHWDLLTSSGNGTPHSPGGAAVLNKPSLVDNFENHLFLGGDRTAESVVAHSAPNNAINFNVNDGAGQLSAGFDVVQFKPFRDNLFVFGENAIKKASPDTTSGFVLDNVTANVGCIARDSVVEIGGDLVFLSPDGFRPVAGTSRIGDVEIESISKNIQQLLTDLPITYDLDNLNAVVLRSKSQVRYFIGDDSRTVDASVGIIGGLRSADQRLGWEFGELLGIRASCCDSAYVGGIELVLHGDYDGKVYKQESGKSFNGSDIVAIYTTPYFDFGDTETRKIFRKVNTFVRAEGPITVNMSLTYDWDDPRVTRPSTYTQDSAGAPVKYNTLGIIYAGTNVNYGGTDKPIIITPIQGSGYAVQLTYVTLGVFDPYSIQGMVFEFSVAGRR